MGTCSQSSIPPEFRLVPPAKNWHTIEESILRSRPCELCEHPARELTRPVTVTNLNLAGMRILVVEDDAMLRKRIIARMEALGAACTPVETLAEVRAILDEQMFDFVFLDMNLPDGSGATLLAEKVFPAATGVIVITAQGGVTGAVEAMRLGAVDYLVKPFDVSELSLALDRAQSARQSVRLDEHRREAVTKEAFYFGTALAGLETQLAKIIETDRRIGTGLSPVLIEGETGTGKTSIARWLHEHGPRARQPLVEVNCSALPESLAESELFGHERGAFTDAKTTRLGLFEAASGGTLFLDELPSLSPALQSKVLSAIEDRRIRRVGSSQPVNIDVRIVAATNRNLKELVSQGAFREDLLHRLDLFRLRLVPLRERGDDVLTLANRLIERTCERHHLPTRSISAVGLSRLLGYHWPGNVRELAHEVERAVVFEDGPELGFPQLGPGIDLPASAVPTKMDWFNPDYDFNGFTLDNAIDRFIQIALQRTGGNVSAAGRLLGVPRDYIRYRLYGPRGQKARQQPGE